MPKICPLWMELLQNYPHYITVDSCFFEKKYFDRYLYFSNRIAWSPTLRDLDLIDYLHHCAGLISVSAIPCQSIRSSFNGTSLQLPPSQKPARETRSSRSPAQITMMAKPRIQFIQGIDEQTIPDVKLTKSRDGTSGVATFTFEQPSVFDSSSELGDITGFYMIDEEGVLQSVDVSAKFVNGKPARIEAKYVMRTPQEWDRFMRFMERYSQANGLQFIKK